MLRKTLQQCLSSYDSHRKRHNFGCFFSDVTARIYDSAYIKELKQIAASPNGKELNRDEQFRVITALLSLEYLRKIGSITSTVSEQLAWHTPCLVWMLKFDKEKLISLTNARKAFVITDTHLHYSDRYNKIEVQMELSTQLATELMSLFKINKSVTSSIKENTLNTECIDYLAKLLHIEDKNITSDFELTAALGWIYCTQHDPKINPDNLINEFGNQKYTELMKLFCDGEFTLDNYNKVVNPPVVDKLTSKTVTLC